MFARFELPAITISDAFVMGESNRISRFLFCPSRKEKVRAINAAFKRDLHYVGEWHTHPEQTPSPSNLDLDSMKKAFIESKHELNHFMMVIVGNEMKSLNLYVSLHNESGMVFSINNSISSVD